MSEAQEEPAWKCWYCGETLKWDGNCPVCSHTPADSPESDKQVEEIVSILAGLEKAKLSTEMANARANYIEELFINLINTELFNREEALQIIIASMK